MSVRYLWACCKMKFQEIHFLVFIPIWFHLLFRLTSGEKRNKFDLNGIRGRNHKIVSPEMSKGGKGFIMMTSTGSLLRNRVGFCRKPIF